jgi:hypothetical protein
VGGLLVLLTLYLSNEIWTVLGVNGRIRQLVIDKIRPALGSASSVGEVEFGLSRLHLRDVSLQFTGSPVALFIPELELRYGLKSFIRGGFRPEKSTDRLYFRRPRLTFWPVATDSASQVDLSLDISEEMASRYRQLLREYNFIRKVVIEDGEIAYVDSASGREIRAIREIDGLLEALPDGKALVQVSGKLFASSNVNAYMRAGIDFARGGLDSLAVVIDNHDLREGLPFRLPPSVQVEKGNLSGRLLVREKAEGSGFALSGELRLTDGQFQIGDEHLVVSDTQVELELRDGNLYVREAVQNVNGFPVVLSGQIRDLFDPQLDLLVSASSFDVGAFLRQWRPKAEVPVEGKASFRIRITDSPLNPVVSGQWMVPDLRIRNVSLRDLSGSVVLAKSQLRVSDISSFLGGTSARIEGQGVVWLNTPEAPMDLELRATGEFAPALQTLGVGNLSSCTGSLDLRLRGSVAHPVAEGKFDVVWTALEAEPFPLSGNLTYESGGLTVEAGSSEHEFRIKGAVADLWDRPSVKLQASNVENTLVFWSERLLASLRQSLAIDVFLQGRLDALDFLVEGYAKPSRRKVMQLYGTSRPLQPGQRRLDGTLTFFPRLGKDLRAQFEAIQSKDRFDLLSIEARPYLSGALTADLTPGGQIDGSLKVSGLPLTELVETPYVQGKPAYRGDLYGSVLFQGPSVAPKAVGNFWLLKGFFNGVGEFAAELSFELDRQGVNVPKWALTRGGSPYLHGSLHYLFGSDEVDAEIRGASIDAEDFLQALTGYSGFYDGVATIDLRAKGQGPRVPLYGSIDVRNGRLLDLRFDQMNFRFGTDPEQPTTSYVGEGYLRSEEITVSRTGAFTLVGNGALPLVGGKELRVHLGGEGNFTPLLSDLSDLFLPSDTRARLSLNVAGGYTSPLFPESELEILEGSLRLSAVAPEIKNLQGRLSITSDGDFLSIDKLTGTVGGKSITVTNIRNPDGVNHGAQIPLRLGGDGLSLGTLIVQTNPKGVLLNIPGVMPEKEYGWFSVSGLEPGEDFYISGPWRRPLVRGEVRLRDVNIIFPFEEDGAETNPVVQNILYNINWDVRVVSRKDTRYVKEIPAANLYLNVKMDDNASALRFRGIWRDSTFRIEGHLESTQGIIEYLSNVFRLEWFTADFDPSDLFPVVSGRAWTVVEDSTRFPVNVYLTLYTVDDATLEEVQRGRWEKIRVKVTSDRPTYLATQREVFNTLGYSWDTMEEVIEKGVEVAGAAAEYQTLGRVLRPFERQLERALKLDVVRFSSRLTQNILEMSRLGLLSPSLSLLRSSRLMLGKYLSGDLYFIYTGQLESGLGYHLNPTTYNYGLRHSVDLKYRINSEILLEMEYYYNNLYLADKDDARVWLRWSFSLSDKK